MTDFPFILNSPEPRLTDEQVDELLATGNQEWIFRLGCMAMMSKGSAAKMRKACAEIEVKHNG